MAQTNSYLNDIYSSLIKQFQPTLVKSIASLGFLLVLKKAFSFISSISSQLFLRGYNISERYGKGSWAVITGATSGIGSEFANQLAGLGFNIVLIGRNQEYLQMKVEQIKASFGESIQIKTLQIDLINSQKEGFFDTLYEQLKDLDISILVNNAGVGGGASASLMHNVSTAVAYEIMVVNTISYVLFTKKLIPHLLQRNKKSAIINVSAVNGLTPVHSFSFYNASKAFVDIFSRGLKVEYGNKIDILSIRFGNVCTRLNSYAQGISVITPEQAIKAALSKLGVETYSFGHWKHQIMNPFYTSQLFGPSLYRKQTEYFGKNYAQNLERGI